MKRFLLSIHGRDASLVNKSTKVEFAMRGIDRKNDYLRNSSRLR